LKEISAALAHRLFYPGVPAVLAAMSRDTVAAMPVISYVALSEEPPLFGVSCAQTSFTLGVVKEAHAFSVCLLGAESVASMELLASGKGRRGSDKLMGAGLKHRPGRRLGVPIISGSVAALECSLERSLKTGDHVLVVGRVEAASASSDFRDYWRFRSYRPILYTGWRDGMGVYKP
jgi:flavin reductase (DIM6/NTAB) family NADH-FMN oxidoreductase RutF